MGREIIIRLEEIYNTTQLLKELQRNLMKYKIQPVAFPPGKYRITIERLS
jgi:hypothetical protein